MHKSETSNNQACDEVHGIDKVIEILGPEELTVLDKISPSPMILFNDEEILYINDSCIHMLGYEKEELSNCQILNPLDIFEKDGFSLCIDYFLKKNALPRKQEITMLNKNKDKIYVNILGEIVEYNSKKCILANLVDMTYIKNVESNLSRISKLRDLMLEISRIFLKTEDINELFQFVLEKALESIENGTVGTIMKKEGNYFKLVSHVGFSDDINDFILPIEDSFLFRATKGKMDRIANVTDLMSYKNYYGIELSDGEESCIKSTIAAPIYKNGNLFGMISIDSVEINAFDEGDSNSMEFMRNYIEIVLSNYLLYREKSRLAKSDQLTNLYNRYYVEEQINILEKKALESKGSFSVVMFDINGLKNINDSFGHLTGDLVIKEFANELKNNIRKSDILWRAGGDEFAGIFFNTDKSKLDKKLDTLLSKIENNPLMIDGNNIKYTFSYGIADFPQDGNNIEELLEVADSRMYKFKKEYKF